MKLRIKNICVLAAVICMASGCSSMTSPPDEAVIVPEETADDEDSAPTLEPATATRHHDYQITGIQAALVTDISSVMDHGFNQAALKGIQTYADAACVSYSCYNTYTDTAEAYRSTILTAIENDAELIICVGAHFEQAVGSLQNEYKDVSFLLLDGVPRDAQGNETDIAPNVHCITYREEEAGYLAGYMAVMEGYSRFGFIGGEEVPGVMQYGYGYVQGIDDAAAIREVSDDIQVDYWYAGTFSPDQQIEEVAAEWYEAGTEIIFACGGALYESVLSSAQSCDGMLIGADVDQSNISELFLTSAVKGIDSSIIVALDDFFASGRKWPEDMAGTSVSYGANEKCISLPVQDSAWRFQNVTAEEYLEVLARLKMGEIDISIDSDTRPETTVTVIYHDQQEEKDS